MDNTFSMNFKRLYDSAIVPTRGSDYAAGYDLYACGRCC